MRIIISIEHPAWAHQFKEIIKRLENAGHIIKVAAIDKDNDLELLRNFNISYELIADSTGTNVFEKAWLFYITTYRIFKISRKFKPDIFIGRASPMMAINSFLFRKPHVIFEDTEHAAISLFFCKLFTNIIVTSNSFTKNLGSKQLRVNAYKELFYLHPNVYIPNNNIINKLNLPAGGRFFIVRFVAWNADHDIGQSGFSLEGKRQLIDLLSKYGKVFITSEEPLPTEFEKFRMFICPTKIHDLLYYATMYIGEGGTMASEAAVLGTPSIFVSTLSAGVFQELEEKYDLMYSFNEENQAFIKIKELLKIPELKIKWQKKRQKLLEDKIDVTAWMVDLIEDICVKSK